MPLFRGSRYRFGKLIQSRDADFDFNSTHVLRQTTVDLPVGTRPYTTKAGDTFEAIAAREYGDGNKWYILADANPDVFFPLDLDSGTLIQIPPKSFASQQ